jgi:membrane protein
MKDFVLKFGQDLWRYVREFAGVIVATWRQMVVSDVSLLAGSLSFSTVISIVPLLAVSLSLFNAYAGFESLVAKIEPFIIQNFVAASGADAIRVIRFILKRIHSRAFGWLGLLGLMITATKLFYDIEQAVQRVWQIQSHRSIFKSLIVYWFLMLVGPLIFASVLGLVTSNAVGLKQILSSDMIAAIFVFFGLYLLNKSVPAAQVRVRSAFVASVFTTLAFLGAQHFYAIAMKRLFSAGKLYGSFASIPIFLIWILVLWWICLAGVALTATLNAYLNTALNSHLNEKSANRIAGTRGKINQTNLMLAALALMSLSSCGQQNSSSSVEVAIPRIVIDCTSARCKSNSTSQLVVTVVFTTSGCDRSDFGGLISGGAGPGANASVTCNATSGCFGQINTWVNSNGEPVSVVPSGIYSLCSRIDYNGSYPIQDADTYGVLDNVQISSQGGTQYLRSWLDI